MKFNNILKTLIAVSFIILSIILPVGAEETETVEEKINPLEYQAHVATIGWQGFVASPEMAGTTGKGLAMEALELKKDPEEFVELEVEAHVQDKGWMAPVTDGIAGTTGEGKQLEAVKIKTTGFFGPEYNVSYRAHIATIGWQDWVSNGEIAGTTGQGLPIEAIMIKVTYVVDPDDASGFVALDEFAPDIMQEVRYYSTYNFVGDRIDGYEQPTILISRAAAEQLKAVNDEMMQKGYRLKVYDAYRPQMAVNHFVRWAQDVPDQRMKPYFYPEVDKSKLFDEGYIAEYSGHTRGSTVDLTLFDMNTGKDLDMGGTFDYFGERSHPS